MIIDRKYASQIAQLLFYKAETFFQGIKSDRKGGEIELLQSIRTSVVTIFFIKNHFYKKNL